ncbi:tripeptide transporter permease [Klebsiella pneumoniae]|uniref:Tripeptide transporter permease n=1 Tax=Klebsiella pneumoniae TaxID=573 RepID=A0A377WIY3_KLEPN|nr:tripeptide transporter permease [Klebsiella pneumoniae]
MVVLVAIATWLLHNQGIARMVLGVVALGIVVIFAKETIGLKGAPRRKMIVAFLLMVEAIVFFVLYSQMPTSLNFFAIRNVEHSILGLAFEPEQYQALNPFWIMIGSRFWPPSTTRWATACRCRTNLLSVWYCALAHSSSCL